MRRTLILALTLAAALPALAGKGKVIIANRDGAGVGFNDPTPAAPVEGNPGTTIGAQRLYVFNAAAQRWSALLDTDVDIIAQARFGPQPCTETNTVLASAGPVTWHRDFAAAPLGNTWYPVALANKLTGHDIAPLSNDITITFNALVDDPACLGESGWYYGLDGNEGTDIDLLSVVMHELAHGLGMSGNGSSPSFFHAIPSIADVYTFDRTTGRSWAQMTLEQREASVTNTGNLVWTGDSVRLNTHKYLQPVTLLAVSEPSPVAADYEIGEASFGASANTTPLTGKVVRATDAIDEDGPSATDGCSPFTNAAAIAGNIAMIDRGDCPFVQKARNAQAAGATGVIIADRENTTCQAPGMTGDAPDVTIPVVSIRTTDGTTLKAQLNQNVQMRASLRVDPSQLAGTSKEGHMRLYAPCSINPGSSTRHWDVVASPNLLMEPSINGDVDGVDLTLYQMLDIGWTKPRPRSGRAPGRR